MIFDVIGFIYPFNSFSILEMFFFGFSTLCDQSLCHDIFIYLWYIFIIRWADYIYIYHWTIFWEYGDFYIDYQSIGFFQWRVAPRRERPYKSLAHFCQNQRYDCVMQGEAMGCQGMRQANVKACHGLSRPCIYIYVYIICD